MTGAPFCESCVTRPAYRRVQLSPDVAPFWICQRCDLAALETERRPTVLTTRAWHLRIAIGDAVADDTPDAIAARRAVLETIPR